MGVTMIEAFGLRTEDDALGSFVDISIISSGFSSINGLDDRLLTFDDRVVPA